MALQNENRFSGRNDQDWRLSNWLHNEMQSSIMTDDGILQRLAEIFRHVFDNDDLVLKPEMTSEDVEGWDSMSTITLAMEIERRFGIKIKMADMESLKSVRELTALIRSSLPVTAP